MDRASINYSKISMKWQVAKFEGEGADLNSLLNYLLEEGVEEPTAIVTELESPAVSLSCNDPEEIVNWENVRDEEIDVFRRSFTGSGIYLDPGDFHFVFALPSPEYDQDPVNRYVHPVIESTFQNTDIDVNSTDFRHDYSLRLDGKPVADFNMRKNSGATVIPGFVSIQPWDANEISSYIDLRGSEERDYISNMPSLSEHTDLDREEYEQIFVREIAETESLDEIEFPIDYSSDTSYSENGYHGPYTGFCPVVPDLLGDEFLESGADYTRSLESE